MDIVVCIKQVPDTTEVRINPETNTLVRDGVPSIINPMDENALEAALQLRDQHGGKVVVITMGPPQATEALRTAIAMGADEVYLISDRAFAGSDTWATSYTLAQAIKKIGHFDLILCGKQAVDGDTAQVGPGIAEWLNLPQVTFAVKIGAEAGTQELKVERLLEEVNEIVSIPLPCLVTVVKQINEPRLPSLKGMMKAKKAEIKTLSAQDISADPKNIGLNGSPTKVVKIFSPPPKGGGEMLAGEPAEIAAALIGKLKERKLV
ncbi:electron transfer flavoprotein subunit beta [candidate division WOR-1 bacterium RIFOXYA12_FULL_52_29]|uniref:Electron transfer flavoprotein small subunit n=1 Tax=candidate division WOR-1 bacterium RIFOXYC12_FULL_54_18 TaxID=1802584 RepID=A0A1F4T6P3_UNCSA|nr:MAG: electron transfer flavoprotein subunit beta [candidate division WOR-1 bacterium RIFOXYA2_FULL_51_19]OGC18044.1 MAG: electron transfer flavoprotein subunit beta [candidate division WOR-1 bacterium RIFOXYA12_FULL_52_29]OGC26900.1 MAG: electron transfer flavoprotein subunit beta [candidate division WOR-1 bacterium RIFOXYB2_FULL_45_9]OGC28461.1 MAG: electron transfer flavoprotein subunit beta [candidate division WOR-1 bacterium RIFOXYC12_FULL_54_18]OGC31084.1 MAG: electron transfer flavopro